jgi:hypothetical protein
MSHPHDCDDDCVCMSCQRRKAEKERDDALRAFLEKDDENIQLERELEEAKAHNDKLIEIFVELKGCSETCDVQAILAWVDPADRVRVRELQHRKLAAEKEAREREEATSARLYEEREHYKADLAATRAKLEAAEAALAVETKAHIDQELIDERAAHAETKRLAEALRWILWRRMRT